MSMPVPSTRLTFSSFVIAAMTSFVALLPSCGGSAGLAPNDAVAITVTTTASVL